LISKFDSRLLGGILLTIGTSIGAGMLALPISTAQVGFVDSVLFLTLSWLIMTVGALLVLEVNLYLPPDTNMISMAEKTLGPAGRYLTWLCYLGLLYSLLSAYISGGADILQNAVNQFNLNLPESVASIIFTLGLGLVVYHGIRLVDFLNRGLMLIKLMTLGLLILMIAPHISLSLLAEGEPGFISGAVMILLASFGFASIIPSLRSYFDGDIPKLRKAIIIGSIIPLFSYIAWDAALMGVIPNTIFSDIASSGHTTTALTDNLSITTQSLWIADFFRLFAAICMFTAFLGVSIGLFDFLADGLHLRKNGLQGRLVFALTFLPPLIVVLFYPAAYLKALQYAGLLCVILLVLLPTAMAYRGRYVLRLSHPYQFIGGKITLLIVGFFSILLLLQAIIEL
jgi:tyrosine-specific transport protein